VPAQHTVIGSVGVASPDAGVTESGVQVPVLLTMIDPEYPAGAPPTQYTGDPEVMVEELDDVSMQSRLECTETDTLH